MDRLEPEWLQAPGKSEINLLSDAMRLQAAHFRVYPRELTPSQILDLTTKVHFNFETRQILSRYLRLPTPKIRVYMLV